MDTQLARNGSNGADSGAAANGKYAVRQPRRAVILAAGMGSRLGGVCKALLTDSEGQSYLARCVLTARAAGVHDIVVVVGSPFGDEVCVEAQRLQVSVTSNPEPKRGMASSVSFGFSHVAEHFASADCALLWPVDHAHVRSETLDTLFAEQGDIVVPTHQGRGGHPTLFSRALWPELVACTGAPDGARSVVCAQAERVTRVEVADPGVVRDVDEPGDR